MLGKLQAIVISDGVNPVFQRNQYLLDTLTNQRSLFGFRCGQNRILSFVFHKSGNNALMAFADDRIAFPVPNTGFIVNDCGPLVNADTVGNASPAILFSVTLAPFFLATQVFMEIASLIFVLVNIEVNTFVADRDTLFHEQATRDLFWAPVLRDKGFNQGSCSCVDARLNFFMLPYHRFSMSLFWAITTKVAIAL